MILVVAIVGVGIIAFMWGKKSDLVTLPVSTTAPMTKLVMKEQLATVADNIIPSSYIDPMIEWYSEPKKSENLPLFIGGNVPKMITYELGSIRSGDDQGALLYSVVIDTQSLDGDMMEYFLKRKDGSLLFMRSISGIDFFDVNFYKGRSDKDLYVKNLEIFSKERYSGAVLKSLEYPSRLVVDGKALVKGRPGMYGQYMFDASYLKLVLRDPYYGAVYTTDQRKVDVITENIFSQHKFYLRAPDGTYREYDIDYSVIKNVSESGVLDYKLAITWNDGSKNMMGYGEGVWHADSIENEAEFRVVGKTKVGDVVYEYVESNPRLKEAFDNSLKYAKENMSGPAEYRGDYDVNMTFKDFVMKHPIIFWKDSFGRWIRFVNVDFRVDGL